MENKKKEQSPKKPLRGKKILLSALTKVGHNRRSRASETDVTGERKRRVEKVVRAQMDTAARHRVRLFQIIAFINPLPYMGLISGDF